jgi:hypothetical protein
MGQQYSNLPGDFVEFLRLPKKEPATTSSLQVGLHDFALRLRADRDSTECHKHTMGIAKRASRQMEQVPQLNCNLRNVLGLMCNCSVGNFGAEPGGPLASSRSVAGPWCAENPLPRFPRLGRCLSSCRSTRVAGQKVVATRRRPAPWPPHRSLEAG